MSEIPHHHEGEPEETHPFLAYIKENARIMSLREQFSNFLISRRGKLPEDNQQCAELLRKAIDIYFENQKR